MTTIATICARGGSKGLPGKNLRSLRGRPLIVHSIEQALACPAIDAVYVSTDDERIARVARDAGAEVPFLRPSHLAADYSPKVPVIEHLVSFLEARGLRADKIVDLDVTSPLRRVGDIEACLELLDDQTDLVITGYEAEKNPYFNMVEVDDEGLVRLCKRPSYEVVCRQQAPKVYAMNASIYVWHRHSLHLGLWGGRVRIHVMPRERSIDIDSWIDFRLVELLMEESEEWADR